MAFNIAGALAAVLVASIPLSFIFSIMYFAEGRYCWFAFFLAVFLSIIAIVGGCATGGW